MKNESVRRKTRFRITAAVSGRITRILLLCAAAALICAPGAAAEDPGSETIYQGLEEARMLEEKTGPAADVSEVSLSQDEMIWYVRGISGKLKDVSLSSQMEDVPVSEYGMLGEEGGPAPKTLILVDNSNSVAHAYQDGPARISSILTRLIWNHQSGEKFAIKTFSKDAQTVLDFTDNYDQLRLALEQIVYQDQQTYLRNVLYEQIYELMQDGEDAYKRIILVSDGSDDSRLGVTYAELTNLLNQENFFLPIYTVAPNYQPSEGELDKVFALSRMTGTPYFYLPEYDNPTDIADGIVADGHKIAYFRIPVPAGQRTGEFRGFTLSASAAEGKVTLEHTLLMPYSSPEDIASVRAEEEGKAREETEAEKALRQEIAALKERIEALEKEAEEEQENGAFHETGELPEEDPVNPSDRTEQTESEIFGLPSGMMKEFLSENREYFFFRSIRSLIWAVLGILLLMLIGYLIYGDRTRRNRRAFEEIEEDADREAVKPDLSRKLTERVILYDPGQPGVRYEIGIGQDQTIGRARTRCDIAFPMDRFMAGRQARIYFRDGKVYIENLDSDNALKMDDRPVKDTAELKNGSRLTMGSTELRVQYE